MKIVWPGTSIFWCLCVLGEADVAHYMRSAEKRTSDLNCHKSDMSVYVSVCVCVCVQVKMRP